MNRLNAGLLGGVCLLAFGCSDTDATDAEDARAVPVSQSAAARALRLPRMRPAPVRDMRAGETPYVVTVRAVLEGQAPADTTVQVRSFAPACGATFVDTAVARNASAIIDAIVWIEGPTPVVKTIARDDKRPIVALEGCRLRPRVQIAAPGSSLQLVMRDSLPESLVVVPSWRDVSVDTIAFTLPGQLVPTRGMADSVGVVAVYAASLPWARSFVAIVPSALAAITDRDGRAQFSLDGAGKKTIVRAWHPSLGIATLKLDLSPARKDYDVTITFRR
jgi:hypothetical protein